MTPARLTALALALAAAGLIGDGAARPPADSFKGVAFDETAWPFLLDQWGRGRAFRCEAARCGAEVMLYLRAKVGFCDCFNHVDEDDVDRLTDFDLMGGKAEAVGEDWAVPFAAGPARLRAFRIGPAAGPRREAVSMVAARDCQALTALMVSDRAIPQALRSAMREALAASNPSDPRFAWND